MSVQNQDYLEQMLSYYTEIRQFTDGYTKPIFSADVKTVRAVSNNLICIGELTNCLDKELKETHPEIPWFTLKNIRNHLAHAHEYSDITTRRVWDITSQQLPQTMQNINNISMEIYLNNLQPRNQDAKKTKPWNTSMKKKYSNQNNKTNNGKPCR